MRPDDLLQLCVFSILLYRLQAALGFPEREVILKVVGRTPNQAQATIDRGRKAEEECYYGRSSYTFFSNKNK